VEFRLSREAPAAPPLRQLSGQGLRGILKRDQPKPALEQVREETLERSNSNSASFGLSSKKGTWSKLEKIRT